MVRPLEVEVHLCKEAHMTENEHNCDETGEAQEEKKNVSLISN